jgi:hypothetical protein
MTQDERRTDAGASQMLARYEMTDLYRRAFAQFGTRALWNIKQVDNPTVEQILAITRQLRTEGDMNRTSCALSRPIAILKVSSPVELADARRLTDAGYDVIWLRQQPAIYAATIVLKKSLHLLASDDLTLRDP